MSLRCTFATHFLRCPSGGGTFVVYEVIRDVTGYLLSHSLVQIREVTFDFLHSLVQIREVTLDFLQPPLHLI